MALVAHGAVGERVCAGQDLSDVDEVGEIEPVGEGDLDLELDLDRDEDAELDLEMDLDLDADRDLIGDSVSPGS